MPNGGPDCCGTCWFNRANGGEAGDLVNDRSIPSHCEIRNLDVPDPFYTYCANHPYQRPQRDQIPIGPVYVNRMDGGSYQREEWEPSPDSEEIRQHLLDIVRLPEEHMPPTFGTLFVQLAHMEAIWQLVTFRDERVVTALEELSQRPEMGVSLAWIEETIRHVRERLGL